MAKSTFLSDLVEQLTNALPSQIGTLKKDFEKNCRSILNKTFAKFDIVRREEFDVQTKVLARTRKKCETLEAEIKKLEKMLEKMLAKKTRGH